MKPSRPRRPSQAIDEIVRIAKGSRTREKARAEISRLLRHSVSMSAIDNALFRARKVRLNKLVENPDVAGIPAGTQIKSLDDRMKTEAAKYARQKAERKLARAHARPTEPMNMLQRLFKETKRGPSSFVEICNRLDLSPSRTRALIEEAKIAGLKIKVENDHVGIDLPTANDKIQDTSIAPVIGVEQKLAVITDLHLGSKYCLRAQLRDFILHAYEGGVREILVVGDVLDGDYRHGKFEMSHMGIEEQTRDLFETLPRLKGLSYHGITGNHDFTFTEESGVDVGAYISNYFAKRGRNDVHFYGDRGAFLRIRGAVIHMWHPSGGVSYALSYKMQKKIESYSSGMKPQLLFIGHWHRFCYVIERGIHALACGTFQGGGSAFSKSLTSGAPAIGGQIVSFTITKDGTLRDVRVDRRSYFELETAMRIDGNEDGIQVVKAGRR